jgi:hypothetical protein
MKKQASKQKSMLILIFLVSFLTIHVDGNGPLGEIFQSTFFGGQAQDRIRDLCLDSQGNIIIVGGTLSHDFLTQDAIQENYAGGEIDPNEHLRITGDAFIAKFTPDLDLCWSTYLGGSDLDEGLHVITGEQGEVIVFGVTTSDDFPVTSGSKPTEEDIAEQFISIYSPDGELIGTRLYFSDEIGEITDVKTDSSRQIVMVGFTESETMYTTEDALQSELAGEIDGFLRILDYDLQTIIYSTYIGGSGTEYMGDIFVDQDDSFYLEISTTSQDFPVTENSIRSEFLGETDNVIIKLSPNHEIEYSTFFGGSGMDHFFGISEGPDDSIVLVGRTWSTDFPVTSNAIQTEYSDVEVDGVFVQISESGDLVYSSYFGRTGWDSLLQIDMDESNRIIISGFVDSTGFEMVNAFQSEYMGATESFIIILDENGEFDLISYLGGYNFEHPFAQVVKDGVLYQVGQTTSSDFPVSEDAYQDTHGGSQDGYIWIMDYDTYLSSEITETQGSIWKLNPSMRSNLSYFFVYGTLLAWYLYMRKSFKS